MSIAADTRTRMITQLDEWQRQAQGNGFFQRVRLAARERLEVIEFPTIKNEDWKYTNLSPFFKEAFQYFNQIMLPTEKYILILIFKHIWTAI